MGCSQRERTTLIHTHTFAIDTPPVTGIRYTHNGQVQSDYNMIDTHTHMQWHYNKNATLMVGGNKWGKLYLLEINPGTYVWRRPMSTAHTIRALVPPVA